MSTPPPPAGWFPDPQDPNRKRYWDGNAWTDHTQQAEPTVSPPPMAAPQSATSHAPVTSTTDSPKKRRTGGIFIKVFLAIILAAVVLIGGCMALIGGVATEVDKDIQKDQNKHAITDQQARELPLGTPRSEVIAQFGPPESMQEGETQGLGEDSCLYYNVRDGEFLESWQFCFGNDDTLRSKNKY